MLNNIYNSNYQIVQTPDAVAIEVEMVHDVRTIPVFAAKAAAQAGHGPAALHPWLGDSTGWWEGDALVVETLNVNAEQGRAGPLFLTPQGRVDRALPARLDRRQILYSFEVRGSHLLHPPLARRDEPERQARPPVRIRLPRRQLRHEQHPARRAGEGKGGGRTVRHAAMSGAPLILNDIQQRLDARKADLSGSTFTDVNLANARFSDVNLAGATIHNANLSGVSLADCRIHGLTFTNVNLAGVRLSDVNLAGAVIRDANLSGVSLTDCRIDGLTVDGIALTDLLDAYRKRGG